MSARVSAKILTWPRKGDTSRGVPGSRKSRVLVLGSVLLVVLAGFGISRTPLFAVDSVSVQGVAGERQAEVLRVVALRTGAPVVSVDERSIQKRLEKIPWVASADVSAPLSGEVKVAVTERAPVALVQTSDRRWAQLSMDGRVLAIFDTAPKGLPAILETQVAPEVGAGLDPAFAVLLRVSQLLPDSLRPNVIQMAASGGNVRLGLSSGTIVEVGNDRDLPGKLMSAATVLSHSDPKKIAVLDVRSPHLPIATPRT